MSGLFIGYARVSTEEQDLTAQRNGLTELGFEADTPSRSDLQHLPKAGSPFGRPGRSQGRSCIGCTVNTC